MLSRRSWQFADAAAASLSRMLVGIRPRPCLGRWDSHDVLAHVVDGLLLHASLLSGQASPMAFGEASQHAQIAIDAARGTPGERLGTRLVAASAGFRDIVCRVPEDQLVCWHGGTEIPAGTLKAVALGELLVHGYDIARATGTRWPLDAGVCAELIMSLGPALELLGNGVSGPPRVLALRLRRHGQLRLDLRPTGLHVTVGPSRRPHCVVNADPRTALLCCYRRRNPYLAAAAGKLIAYGREPWLAHRLPALLPSL